MSSEQEQVRSLAERIARRVAESSAQRETAPANESHLNDELTALRRTLSELQQRLANIESHLAPQDNTTRERTGASGERQQGSDRQTANERVAPAKRSPWMSSLYVPVAHPSQEQFGVEEATVAELVDFFEGEKTCELEPGGKPCDHCAMCSTRGF